MWVSGIFLLGLVAPTAAAPTEPDVGDTPAAAQGPSAAPPAATPAADDAGAPPTDAEAPPEAAPQPAASASQVPAASSSSPDGSSLPPAAAWMRTREQREAVRHGITERRPSPPVIGEGFHVFDPKYLTLGVNTQSLCQAAAWELEASVAWIWDSMFWLGAYGAAGVQVGRRPDGHQSPSENEACFERHTISYRAHPSRRILSHAGDGYRFGMGGEVGWRMLGLDLGYLRNTALTNQDHGFRLRAGLALAEELFTGGMTRYGKQCCSIGSRSAVPCECPRTLVGLSLFFYYAREQYVDRRKGLSPRHWGQNSVGLSLKLAVGVGGGR